MFQRTAIVALVGTLSISTVCDAQMTAAQWKTTNEYRALRMQHALALDMPLSQNTIIGSHNSYNSINYASPAFPVSNHTYTLSEQLDFGVRMLDIDVHWGLLGLNNHVPYVTHQSVCTASATFGQPLMTMLQEIRAWLDANPGEVVYINSLSQFFNNPQQRASLLAVIDQTLGSASPGGNVVYYAPFDIPATIVPSFVLNQGKQIVISGGNGPCAGNADTTDGQQNNGYVYYNWWRAYASGTFPSGADDALYRGYIIFGAKEFEDGSSAGGYWQNALGSRLPATFADGTPCTDAQWHSVESRASGDSDSVVYGQMTPAGVREAVRAGADMILLDPIGRSQAQTTASGVIVERDAAALMTAAIWSWDPQYLPPARMPGGPLNAPLAAVAVVTGDTARLQASAPSNAFRFARQDVDGEWRISNESGAFSSYPGVAGATFRVPGNGFEMQNLFGAMVRAGVTAVWVNYSDIDGDGAWTASTQPRTFFTGTGVNVNVRPVTRSYPVLMLNTAQQMSVLGTLPGPTDWTAITVNPSTTFSQPVTLRGRMVVMPSARGAAVTIGR